MLLYGTKFDTVGGTCSKPIKKNYYLGVLVVHVPRKDKY